MNGTGLVAQSRCWVYSGVHEYSSIGIGATVESIEATHRAFSKSCCAAARAAKEQQPLVTTLYLNTK